MLEANSSIPAFRKKPALDASGAKGHAAGILFVAPDGDVLLLRRSGQEANFAGHWGLPGGGVEPGETPEQGAARESMEEMGTVGDEGPRKLLDQRITPTGMAFHTFVQPVKTKFAPTLNDEHTGFAWAPLDMLPQPLHPAVARTFEERLGAAKDMTPEDWKGLREGFVKWTTEEENEPEHAADERLAMDKDSVREIDRDGRMTVKIANISKATVNPYRGKEIPGWEELGLDPNKIYQMLRPAEELEKAAPTFNGIQLLKRHVPVDANDHQMWDIVGTTGTNAKFENPYLTNSLHVWTKEGIGLIDSGEQKELSSSYHYTPEMTPGNFDGKSYDGVMRDIVGNHVALVKDGRAGPDVVVGDSTENLMSKPTRLAAFTLALTASTVAPLLAMDAKIDLPRDVFDGINSKNFKDSKAAILKGVTKAVDGKLRKGIAMDASVEHVKTVLDALEEVMPESMDESVSEEQHKAMEAAAHGESNLGIPKAVGEEFAEADKGKTFDAEPIKAFLREKGMGEDDIEQLAGMLPKAAAEDEDPDDEEARRKKAEEEQAAKDAKTAKDNEMKDMVTKKAMDAALEAHGSAVEKRVRENERGISLALDEVAPYVGKLPRSLAFDSGDDVVRHALKMLGVDNADKLHADALRPVLGAQKKAGELPEPNRIVAMDAASAKSFAERFPGADRIASVG